MKRTFAWIKNKKWLLALLALAAIIIVPIATRRPPEARLITATRGTIREEISVTGKTKAAQNATLAFEASGRINAVR